MPTPTASCGSMTAGSSAAQPDRPAQSSAPATPRKAIINLPWPRRSCCVGGPLQVPGEAHPGHEVDDPLRRVPVVPADAVAVVHREAVVEIVESFAVGEQGAEPVVARGLVGRVGPRPERVRDRIHAERRMQDDDDAQAHGHDEPAQRMADPPRDEHREDDARRRRTTTHGARAGARPGASGCRSLTLS